MRRGQHGIPLADATDPAQQGRWKVEPVTDFVQAQLNKTTAEFRTKYGDAIDVDALIWTVEQEDS